MHFIFTAWVASTYLAALTPALSQGERGTCISSLLPGGASTCLVALTPALSQRERGTESRCATLVYSARLVFSTPTPGPMVVETMIFFI
jgi:hypothetical protein